MMSEAYGGGGKAVGLPQLTQVEEWLWWWSECGGGGSLSGGSIWDEIKV